MIRSIFLALTLVCGLFANTIVTENDPSTLVNGVSVITGDLFTYQEDYRVQGLQPILLRRAYLSSAGHWDPQPHLIAMFCIDAEGFVISEPNGTSISYFLKEPIRKKHRPKSMRFDPDWKSLPGVTNTASGRISAQTNYKNQYLIVPKDFESFVVHAANGTKRIYRKMQHQEKVDLGLLGKRSLVIVYALHSEELPNGHRMEYHWNHDDQLFSITTQTRLGSVLTQTNHDLVTRGQDPMGRQRIVGSDGRFLCYTRGYLNPHKKKYGYLQHIELPDAPNQTLGPVVKKSKKNGQEKLFLQSIHLPQGRSVFIEYEKKYGIHHHVKRLFAPVGKDGTLHPINSFNYYFHKSESHVTDAYNNLSIYRWNSDHRLTKIETYEGQNKLHHSERFVWDGMHLRCKARFNEQDQAEYAHTFAYNDRGNVCEEIFWGNLSGNSGELQLDDHGIPIDNGVEQCVKRTEYIDDGRNLPKKKEEPNGLVTLFEYVPDTHLLKSKVICDREEAKIHHSYEYDDELILIRETIDDGITKTIRHIQPRKEKPYYGLPDIIEEKYHDGEKEILLRKTVFNYGKGASIEKKRIYDANDVHCYDLEFRYDDKGNLVFETNALGWEATAQYDELDNKIRSQDVSGNVTLYHYDLSDRLILKETIGFDGIQRNFTYEYNHLHYLTLEQDDKGYQTQFVPNAFGERIETRLPENIVIQSKFDSLGREIEKMDADGFATQIRYNAYGQPIWTHHPDGGEERNYYFLDGSLQSSIDATGVETKYTRDYLGRIASKTIQQKGEVLAHEVYEYTGQFLSSKTDAEGHVTQIFYDRGGRKIAEQCDGEQIRYEHDSWGRVHIVEKSGVRTVTDYDGLNRVLEERDEDVESYQVLRKVRYAFDRAGNKTDVWKWVMKQETHERFEYDSQNRLIRHIDSLGAEETTLYQDDFHNEKGQKVLRKTHIDPMGLETIETFDSLGRVVHTEKRNHKQFSQSHKEYNGRGKLTFQTDIIYAPDESSRSVTTRWEYDSCGRLARLIEAEGTIDAKITEYTYTPRGEKATTTKPDGVILRYEYNGLGANTSIRSSDGTVRHTLRYNRLGLLIQHDGISREIDAHGRTLVEDFPNFRIESKYNRQGQRIECRIPQANCLIEYSYQGRDLRSISRKTLRGADGYIHRYLQRDLAGNLLEAVRLDGSTIAYSYDLCSRQQSISTSLYHQQVLLSDLLGNILQLKTQNNESTFTYDALYQLTSERGLFNHDYTLDSLHCRLQKDSECYQVNALNQLVSHIEYDKNGNPRRQGNTLYTFDALERLIQIQTSAGVERYTYDALHRRICAENQEGVRYFLYDGQNEIGSFNETLEFQELRILGLTPHAEIGAAIGIELKGCVYIPIHDITGNVAALVPLQGGDPEITRYSAYGEELGSKLSPWRFSSKRIDATGLIYFGRRYYQSELGRWLSPDPAGFTDGMNLYAFVHNNPLTHFDEYGLWTHPNTSINPGGRFANPGYGSIEPVVMNAWNPSFQVQSFLYSSGYAPQITDFRPRSLPFGMNFKRTFSANTSAQNIATETSISSSNLRLPLTFCANMGATRTPKGLSTFGHGWMQGVNKNGQSFSMGAYLDGMQYEDDKTSFCKRTRHFTVYVSTEQQNQAIRAMNRDHWTSWDNCIDHVVDALIAIEYPLPNGKNSFVKLASRISCPYLFRSWIEKQEGNIPSDFLPNANDRIMPYNFPWTR